MTADPEINKMSSFVETKADIVNTTILEDIFTLGYAKSGPVELYTQDKDGQRINLTVEFRTLYPAEIRDVFEEVQRYQSFLGQLVTEQVETLSRCILTINGMRLVLDQTERDKLVRDLKELNITNPTPMQEARYILTNKIRSPMVMDILYEGYKKFTEKVKDDFDNFKKKLNNPPSSSSTSG